MNGPGRGVLDRYPASSRPTSTPRPLGNAGGLSGARLWRFNSGRGPLVARLWPADGPDLARLEQIHAWLAGVGDLGFVPVPILALDGRTIISVDGRLWEVAPWMPGVADLDRPPAPGRIRAGFAGLAAFLARLASTRSEGPSPGLAARVAEIDRLLLGDFGTIREAVDRAPADPCSPLARAWLDRAAALAPRIVESIRRAARRSLPLQPCLRDARPDHFLFDGDRLTGLVDFGAMGRDTLAGDLARLLAEAIGPDRFARAGALSAFEAIRPLSEAEIRSIEAFESANALLGAGHWVRWHFLEHRRFDDHQDVVRGLRRGLERLDETM
jgi:homoserine kinase type II